MGEVGEAHQTGIEIVSSCTSAAEAALTICLREITQTYGKALPGSPEAHSSYGENLAQRAYLKLNFSPRHLTESQRAKVAAKILIYGRGGGQTFSLTRKTPLHDARVCDQGKDEKCILIKKP
jgi:hypothetical protein